MIKVESLRKEINGREIFHDINLEVQDKDIVGIIGPSGTGKSLLLRCLMRLEQPSGGKIFYDDEEITAAGVDIDKVHMKAGMVFQNFNLFNHMTVIENVMSGLVHLQNKNPDDAYADACRILNNVGMLGQAYRYPDSLSNGQKQRVAIARTLAMNPEVILMDEPTSSLDPMMRGEVESVIRMIADSGKTMVIVSHEMELIRQLCNKVVFLNDGTICEIGSPEKIFENPDKDETRRFVRALRVIEFNIESKTFDFLGMQTTITEFAYRNTISKEIIDRLYAIMEELSQMVIIQSHTENKMNVTFEYNKKENSLDGIVLFSGSEFDEDDPAYFISWPIIKMRASEVSVESYKVDGYVNKMILKLK